MGEGRRVDHSLAVKEYSRSSADQVSYLAMPFTWFALPLHLEPVNFFFNR